MKDKKILKELRNGPMKSMKDDEYAMIEKEVDEKGIAGLKGYAKSMIEKAMREMAYSMKDAVRKHGEHDQSSHGNWATGGMGGAKPPTTPEAWGKEEDELAAKFEREEDMTTSDAQGLAMTEMQRKYGISREKLFAPNSQTGSLRAASDAVVNAYRNDNTGRTGVQAGLAQAFKEHTKAVEAIEAGDFKAASKHSLEAMKSLERAADDAQGSDRTALESVAIKYSESMVRALDAAETESRGSERNESYLFDLQSRSGA
jgi:hypothetical protein